MQDILFEPFSESYFQEVLAIDALCFPKKPMTEVILRSDIAKGTVYILRTPAACVGYIAFTPRSFEEPGYIRTLAIHPNHRRRGYGLMLLQKACFAYRKAEGITEIWVHTRVSNPAQFLYAKAGFKIENVCPKFYDDADAFKFVLQYHNEERLLEMKENAIRSDDDEITLYKVPRSVGEKIQRYEDAEVDKGATFIKIGHFYREIEIDDKGHIATMLGRSYLETNVRFSMKKLGAKPRSFA